MSISVSEVIEIVKTLSTFEQPSLLEYYKDYLLEENTNPNAYSNLEMHNFFNQDGSNLKLGFSSFGGRNVIAKRDIEAGEIVFNQLAYATAVKDNFVDVICAHCFTVIEHKVSCGGCPYGNYCSQSCLNADHSKHIFECDSLKRLSVTCTEVDTFSLRCTISSLIRSRIERIVSQNRSHSDISKYSVIFDHFVSSFGSSSREMFQLMSHSDNLSPEVLVNTQFVVSTIETIIPDFLFNATDARYIYMVQLCNAHTIQDRMSSQIVGMGLYIPVSYANHSCNPSCVYQFVKGKLVMRAVRSLTSEEEITYAYTNLYAPSYERRKKLIQTYHFDPLVEGRYISTVREKEDMAIAGVKCIDCNGSFDYHLVKYNQLPLQPQLDSSEFSIVDSVDTTVKHLEQKGLISIDDSVQCQKCGATLTTSQIDNFLDHLTQYSTHISSLIDSNPQQLLTLLETQVVALSSGPKEKYSNVEVMTVTDFYKRPVPSQLVHLPPPQDFIKLSMYHAFLFNAYATLNKIARDSYDNDRVSKYSLLMSMCLRQVADLQNHPEVADVLMYSANAIIDKAGLLKFIACTSKSLSVFGSMYNPSPVLPLVKRALDSYQKAYTISLICRGNQDKTTILCNVRMNDCELFIKLANDKINKISH